MPRFETFLQNPETLFRAAENARLVAARMRGAKAREHRYGTGQRVEYPISGIILLT